MAAALDELLLDDGLPEDPEQIPWEDRDAWAGSDPFVSWVRIWQKRVRNDWDLLYSLEGPERRGKSTLGWLISKSLDPSFNVDRIVFSAEEYLEAAETLEPYSALLLDEAVLGLLSKEAMHEYVRDLEKYFMVAGERNLITGVCTVNQQTMTPYFKDHRINWSFYVMRRGMAEATTKRKWRWAKKAHFNPVFRLRYGKVSGDEWAAYLRKKREFVNRVGPSRKKPAPKATKRIDRAWLAEGLQVAQAIFEDLGSYYVSNGAAVHIEYFRQTVALGQLVRQKVDKYQPRKGSPGWKTLVKEREAVEGG